MSELSHCVSEVVGEPVPDGDEWDVRNWLSARGLGLVPIADPGSFEWPGRFLGRVAGGEWIVLFGVPPGVIVGQPGALEAAFVIAPHERPVARASSEPGSGVVEILAVADAAEAPMRMVPEAVAVPGRGLKGDRYHQDAGSFSGTPGNGRDLTLVEAEAVEELAATGIALAPLDARRNVVTRGVALDGLIDRRFTIGEVECIGRRRCEPCALLERLTEPGVLRGLVHRGGLRADILRGGTIRAGDAVQAVA
jgi:hypothetical protein